MTINPRVRPRRGLPPVTEVRALVEVWIEDATTHEWVEGTAFRVPISLDGRTSTAETRTWE